MATCMALLYGEEQLDLACLHCQTEEARYGGTGSYAMLSSGFFIGTHPVLSAMEDNKG